MSYYKWNHPYITEEFYNIASKVQDKIDEQDRLTLKKIYNEGKRLQKTVYEKANLRSLTTLFWDVDEGPYKIDF